jgi:hypothetical protein
MVVFTTVDALHHGEPCTTATTLQYDIQSIVVQLVMGDQAWDKTLEKLVISHAIHSALGGSPG